MKFIRHILIMLAVSISGSFLAHAMPGNEFSWGWGSACMALALCDFIRWSRR